MATHSSTLAWESLWTEEPGGLQSMGSQRVGHDSAPAHPHDFPLCVASNFPDPFAYGGHQRCFQFEGIMTKAAINIHVQGGRFHISLVNIQAHGHWVTG